MPEQKMPLFLKGAWLNLVLATGWFLWATFGGFGFSWLWVPYFLVTVGILLFADWAARQGGYGSDPP